MMASLDAAPGTANRVTPLRGGRRALEEMGATKVRRAGGRGRPCREKARALGRSGEPLARGPRDQVSLAWPLAGGSHAAPFTPEPPT